MALATRCRCCWRCGDSAILKSWRKSLPRSGRLASDDLICQPCYFIWRRCSRSPACFSLCECCTSFRYRSESSAIENVDSTPHYIPRDVKMRSIANCTLPRVAVNAAMFSSCRGYHSTNKSGLHYNVTSRHEAADAARVCHGPTAVKRSTHIVVQSHVVHLRQLC